MIHALSQIDSFATRGSSPWHRASALGKLVVAVAVVAVAVFTPSLRLLLLVHAIAWLLVITARVPWRLAAAAVAYPLIFSALLILARWDGDPALLIALLVRPVTSSLTAVWLVSTTPYPDLFAPLSRVLPRQAGDGLFLTYRALFALLDRAGRLVRALRLRGGFDGWRMWPRVGDGLGVLVVHGFERSERLYAAMNLRGHSGRICGCRHFAERSTADVWAVAVSVLILAAAATLWSW